MIEVVFVADTTNILELSFLGMSTFENPGLSAGTPSGQEIAESEEKNKKSVGKIREKPEFVLNTDSFLAQLQKELLQNENIWVRENILKLHFLKEGFSFVGEFQNSDEANHELSWEAGKSLQAGQLGKKIYWRGDHPLKLLPLVLEKEELKLFSSRANVSETIATSIAYRGIVEGVQTGQKNEYSFNVAIGFEPKHGSVYPAPIDTEIRALAQSQQGNYIFNGSIEPEDLIYCAVRPSGVNDEGKKGPGKILVFSPVSRAKKEAKLTSSSKEPVGKN
ncbi:MAG: hypothetical protein G01um101418_924 [Parcubacteria group bacterium Gr01-1014_18]|nr:MAG: hypothetical protein Greene041636_903 [Parcubacteria group bacterium Greene0416_36]TSC79760.1 MAG: hypothetical protein G01um101418_924 [Parcubacteria group bacterium Gr01-1014_18]TSC97904.1 MAG: hypothetical protein Greene101420_939 [Parcubacteria group bacterium Greene1014_20]TSD06024.1 MAG: hypothetical protein Greene07142_955 [Parcubacteria group bacterium Greene0714_2]